MALRSRLFAGDAKLEAAAAVSSAHIVPGAAGAHVCKLQRALILLDDAQISAHDLRVRRYGRSTAQAALAYKTKRQIINTSYETQADDIVGIMTMAALDAEMVKARIAPCSQLRLRRSGPRTHCSRLGDAQRGQRARNAGVRHRG